MMTANIKRASNGVLIAVEGRPVPNHLKGVRIPPAWTRIAVELDPKDRVLAMGYDSVGRKCKLYSLDHMAEASHNKFSRIRDLLEDERDIRAQIEADLNSKAHESLVRREAALLAYLILETGMRPGSNSDTRAQVKAYGATTLELRHVHPCTRGVRLKFVGKKGVKQNVLVVNPYLVKVLKQRKAMCRPGSVDFVPYTTPVFKCSSGTLNKYFKLLGTGEYTPKDFRTLRGTALALKLLGNRQRLPKAKSRLKRIVNTALDKVSRLLGNTRAIAKKSYVDPSILERFIK
jgi:DNA topoisomerase-1